MTAPLNLAQGGSEGDEPAEAAPAPRCQVRDWSTGGRCERNLAAGRCPRHGRQA